jgi:nucleotide-binding universal stress UspA family protein
VYKHILIATDGSELAQKGVDQGLALARDLGSTVKVISVADTYPLQSAITRESWDEAQKSHANEALSAARAAALRLGVKVEVVFASDHSPAEAIVETSKKLGCDLIVMASHGRRGVSRLLLGSQTAEVVHSSSIPVLVVR